MTRRFACLLAATIVLAATPLAVLCATSPSGTADVVNILVDGSVRPRLTRAGRSYIEALKGREYAIRLRNPYPVRVAVALSVDGLNTIDASETTAVAARKWVLDPYETIVISGWQTSRNDARQFEFTTEDKSYGRALGRAANLGVISAVFFKERVVKQEAPRGRTRRQPTPSTPSRDTQAAAESAVPESRAADEYAATGMGRRTDHAVYDVWLNLEESPSVMVDIRYEFRPQLVKLGVLRPEPPVDPLLRRERARGFEPGFSPEPRRRQ